MKKFLKISGISLLVILLLLIAAPFLFKGKIISLIKTEANKNLNATLNFDDDISLSLIKNFPKLSIGINQLSIIGKDTFKGDTLVYLPKFNATLNIMSVIKGEKIEINSIALEQPYINLMVLKNGQANYDIAKTDSTAKDEDTSASKFNLALSKLTITDGRLNYEDQTLPFNTSLKHFNHSLKGDFTADNFLMETLTDAKEFTLGYGGVNYIYKVATAIKANVQMDMKKMKFTFSDNDILLNKLNLLGEGFVDMNENDMDFDLKFKSKTTDFKTILSLVPGMYSSSFDKAKASGKLDFGGYFKGKMTETAMPGYGLKLNIDNGFFQYPDLPKSLNNVFVNLAVDNPTGVTNNMVINLSQFNANIAGEPIAAKLLVKTPTSDPYIDGALKGNVNLSEFRSFIPLEQNTEISGLIKSDVTFNGKVSTLQNNAANFNAAGSIAAEKFHYKDPTNLPQGLNLNTLVNFNPKNITINNLQGNVGMSDFAANGSIDNIFGYILNDELLKGNFTFTSNYFNANEFLTDEPVKKEPTAADSIPLQAFEVPANLDLVLNSKINKVIYDNLTLTDLGGVVRIKDKLMFFDNVGVNLLGGSMNLNGEYNSFNPKFPFSQVDFKVKSLDIIQTFNYLDMVQKLAPIAKYTQGLFNANIRLANNFNQDLSVNYPTVSGTIQMGISEAALKGLPILGILADKLKIDRLKNLSLKNLNFKLNILNGKMELDSMILPLWEGAKAKITGYSALDQSIKYVAKLSIPRKDFGTANMALDNLTNQAKAKGLNLAVSDMVDVDVLIGGFFTKPDVKVSLHDAKKNLVDGLKNQITDQIDAKKQALEEEAKRKAAAAKQKAIDSLNNLKQQGIDKLNAEKAAAEQKLADEKRKLEEKAKAEADKAKAEAEKQAKDKLKKGLDGLLKK